MKNRLNSMVVYIAAFLIALIFVPQEITFKNSSSHAAITPSSTTAVSNVIAQFEASLFPPSPQVPEEKVVLPSVTLLAARVPVATPPLATAEVPAPLPAIPPASAVEGPLLKYPARLVISTIGLDAPVEYMGLNAKGEMDVPRGDTPNVGWYAAGTLPRTWGNAVMDAHVFAAFSNLKNLRVGEAVEVVTCEGSKLRFVVDEAVVYSIAEAPLQKLFHRTDGKWLNLITCAGGPTPDGSTYVKLLRTSISPSLFTPTSSTRALIPIAGMRSYAGGAVASNAYVAVGRIRGEEVCAVFHKG